MTAQSEYNQLNAKQSKLSKRKAWEETKKYAKKWGADTSIFTKGLGPAWERFGNRARGGAEVARLAPIDERTVKPMRAEKAKVDAILKDYKTTCSNNKKANKTGSDLFWAWAALDSYLGSLQHNADEVMKLAEGELRKNSRAGRT
jgi:hypothetical protein